MILVIVALLGVISHWTFWRRHEFDSSVLTILGSAGILTCAIATYLAQYQDWAYAVATTISIGLVYCAAVAASITVYRLLLHPLRAFPGPKSARWSMWWKVTQIAKRGPHHLLMHDIHNTYGDVVRIGPNHLSINSVEALLAIYGSQSPCTKPPSYLIGGIRSLQSERQPHRHKSRRGIWDKALGSQASNAFLPKLEEVSDLMVQKLRKYDGKPIKANDWLHYITYDIMGEFAFSRSWKQLEEGKLHQGVEYASEYLQYAIYGVQIPWLAYTFTQLPFLPDPQVLMMRFARKSLDEREEQTPEVPDAMSHILAHNNDPKATEMLSRYDIESDVFFIQIAGSDTTCCVLIDMLFWLTARPELQRRVRDEIKPAFEGTADRPNKVNWAVLSSAIFLDALIRETMRFHPPVSSGLGRVTPASGLTITPENPKKNSLHIPPNTVVSVPTHSLHHDPRYFVDPDSFVPERWTSKPELILDARAFVPFSIGAYGCAGKYFAYMEAKMVVAKLVMAFQLAFADEGLAGDVERQQSWLNGHQDHMTLQAPELMIKFVPRDGSED